MTHWTQKEKLTVSLEIVGGAWFFFTLWFQGFASENFFGWLSAYLPGPGGPAHLYSAIEYSEVIQLVVLASTLVLGVWLTFRLLHVPVGRARTAILLGTGVSLTLASLAYATYSDGLGLSVHAYGFPLSWFGWVYELGPPYWGISGFPLIVDVLFWTGLAYAGLLLGSRLLLSPRVAGRRRAGP